jgi:hypothetical protein
MALIPGERYPARTSGARLTTSDNGTDGIFVHFDCGDNGGIDHTIWLSPARLEYAEKELNALGVSSEQLRSDRFWEEVENWVNDKECQIVIGEEEYNGNKRLRVKFINAAVKQAKPGAPKRLAGLFGSRPVNGSLEPPKDFPGWDAPSF